MFLYVLLKRMRTSSPVHSMSCHMKKQRGFCFILTRAALLFRLVTPNCELSERDLLFRGGHYLVWKLNVSESYQGTKDWGWFKRHRAKSRP